MLLLLWRISYREYVKWSKNIKGSLCVWWRNYKKIHWPWNILIMILTWMYYALSSKLEIQLSLSLEFDSHWLGAQLSYIFVTLTFDPDLDLYRVQQKFWSYLKNCLSDHHQILIQGRSYSGFEVSLSPLMYIGKLIQTWLIMTEGNIGITICLCQGGLRSPWV